MSDQNGFLSKPNICQAIKVVSCKIREKNGLDGEWPNVTWSKPVFTDYEKGYKTTADLAMTCE